MSNASINAQNLFNGYVARGVPANTASALAGVQAYENGDVLGPNPSGDAPGVWGISQWTSPSRQAAAIAAGAGPGSSMDAQQDFTLQEMQTNNPTLYNNVMNGTATNSDIIAQYEVPSGVVHGQITGGPAANELTGSQNLSAGIDQTQGTNNASTAGPNDAYDPDSGMFDSNSALAPGGTAATPSNLPDGVTTTGTGNFASFDSSTPSSSSDGTGSSVSASTTAAPVSGDLTQYSVAGVNAPANAAVSTGAAPQGNGTNTQGGVPIQDNITDGTSLGSVGLNALAKATTGAGQAVQSSAGTISAAGTSWLGSIFTGVTNTFVRTGLVAVGIVVLLGAFLFFYIDSQKGGGTTVLPVPV